MRILFEHLWFIGYHPTVISGGVQLTSNQYVAALRQVGHEVTYLVPQGSVADSSVTVCTISNWLDEINRLSYFHDIVILNSHPSNELLKFPDLLRKCVIIDHHTEASVRPNVTLLTALAQSGVNMLTVDEVVKPWQIGRLDNHVVPEDRAEYVNHDPKLLIAVGRESPEKRLEMAAEIIAKLEPHGYKGIIFTDRARLPGDVRVGVPHAEIMQWMSKAACLIQPSSIEKNGGCVNFEAASHGLPVIHQLKNAEYFLKPAGVSNSVEGNFVSGAVDAILTLKQPDRVAAREWASAEYNKQLFTHRLLTWLDFILNKIK